jgi:hypothetical protein
VQDCCGRNPIRHEFREFAVKIKNLVTVVATLITWNAHAALFDRGGGLIYDDTLNITWLSDANYAATSGYATDGWYFGSMPWDKANIWATGLSYGGFDDWRLPTALNQDGSGPCIYYNCTNSEMGHMFYNNMGASAGGSILSGTNTANLALVTNLQDYRYWSGTAYAELPTEASWFFGFEDGYQHPIYSSGYWASSQFHAWAVRDGDVAAPVPEPETYAMLLAGLGLLGLTARRRKQKLNA